MDDMDYLHQPKGSMCMACDSRALKCHLNFKAMPVIERIGRTAIVRCTEFKRSTQAAAGEAEFESWLYRLNARAESYCPGTDQMHKEVPVDPSTGYAFRCTLCGHHSIFPF